VQMILFCLVRYGCGKNPKTKCSYLSTELRDLKFRFAK
jgi:hypothetical protein